MGLGRVFHSTLVFHIYQYSLELDPTGPAKKTPLISCVLCLFWGFFFSWYHYIYINIYATWHLHFLASFQADAGFTALFRHANMPAIF